MIPLIIVIVVIVVLALAVVASYNRFVSQRNAVQNAWSDIDTELKRRYDLIPNLVSTVQAYAVQEKTVLTQVTEARAQATHVSVDASTITDPQAFQKFQNAQNQLSGVLGHLLSITENYPDLKSNQNFLALQAQLEGTENRIEIARRDYNGAVQDYNTELRTFPGVIWASTVYKSQKPAQEFAASNAAQGAPVVNFNGQTQPNTTTEPPPPPVNP